MADFDDVTDKASLKYNSGTFCDAYICMYILKRKKKICDTKWPTLMTSPTRPL